MLCYKCARDGKETPASGIGMVCGMGLCKDHVNIAEVTFTEMTLMDTSSIAMLGMERKKERKAPRFLSGECYAGVAQALVEQHEGVA